ncbi:ARM repeat-containing protein [Microthyrium microscopicum]|uniref:Nucleolar protein 9 n=1 Tax=Microthyrium microscopicum TaxID=703497 RepID=A0A6A6U3D3_9PEZI|nr:ARM repeat-containing protein [Microthyrium microscopicum]
MPKENKKRGRRAEKKRKLENAEPEHDTFSKRQKQVASGGGEAFEGGEDYIDIGQDTYEAYEEEGGPVRAERPFYGLLDETEQEFFHEAAQELEQDAFPNDQEREDFLENLFHQTEGKELKMANSQSCSRLLERLIPLLGPEKLKKLFKAFSGQFQSLVQHRFASHCCEILFIRTAPVVTQEIISPPDNFVTDESAEPLPPMEDLFLGVVQELQEHMGWLMTDTFASHPLRVLLLVLSGQPIRQASLKSGLHSRKKENVPTYGAEKEEEDKTILEERAVPSSFTESLESLITTSVAGLDTNTLRSLATHKTGNPILQLLLRLELTHFGKQRAKDESSLFHVLLPDDPITPESFSAGFINGLMYDAVGSRLLETILEYAPSKTFKAIYKDFFKERLPTLARNDIASYVASKALTRLSKEDLQAAITILVPEVESLLERNRLTILRTLIDRSVIRSAHTQPLATAFATALPGPHGFDIARLLKLSSTPDSDNKPRSKSKSKTKSDDTDIQDDADADPDTVTTTTPASTKLHRSLLAQSMLLSPGPLSQLCLNALSSLPQPLLLTIATDAHASHTLTTALSAPHTPVIPRRKLIAHLYGHAGSLSLDPRGSRIITSVWTATYDLAFMRERIAEELAENSASLMASGCGRSVWRTWGMDLYKRRRREWMEICRAGRDGERDALKMGNGEEKKGVFVGFPEHDEGREGESAKRHMKAIDRARERHVRAKRSGASGANAQKVEERVRSAETVV